MKIMILIRTSDHLPYIYNIINKLGENAELIFLLERNWDGSILKRIRESSLVSVPFKVVWAPKRNKINRLLLELKEILAAVFYLREFGQNSFYTKRWLNYLKPPSKTIAHMLAKRVKPKSSHFLQNKIASLFISQKYKALFEDNQIDAVVCTSHNLRFSDQEFALATANFLDLRTFAITLTWDNLTTKSIYLNQPDVTFCWNKFHERSLVNLHNQSRENIKVVGPIYFEKWLKNEKLDKQIRRKKFKILYLGSSANITGGEENILERVTLIAQKTFARQEIDLKVEVIYKSHPAKLIKPPKVLGAKSADKFRLTSTPEEEAMFSTLLLESDLVLGVNTTAMIEATFVNDNVFAILDCKKNTSEDVPHFREMLNQFAIKPLFLGFQDKNPETLSKAIFRSLKSKSNRRQGKPKMKKLLPSEKISSVILERKK